MSQEELQALCEEWQVLLRLQDWRVKALFCRPREMTAEGRAGECEWKLEHRTAVIRILDARDYPEDAYWPQSIEETLVHELLHVHAASFDDFKIGGRQNTALEQMIVAVAHALVSLRPGRVLPRSFSREWLDKMVGSQAASA